MAATASVQIKPRCPISTTGTLFMCPQHSNSLETHRRIQGSVSIETPCFLQEGCWPLQILFQLLRVFRVGWPHCAQPRELQQAREFRGRRNGRLGLGYLRGRMEKLLYRGCMARCPNHQGAFQMRLGAVAQRSEHLSPIQHPPLLWGANQPFERQRRLCLARVLESAGRIEHLSPIDFQSIRGAST